MKFYNVLAPTLLVLLMASCGSNSEEKKDSFSLEIKNPKKTYTTKDVLSVSLNNKKNIETDSVVYFLNKDRIEISGNEISLSGKKLGEKALIAKIYSDGKEYEASKAITILSSIKPKLYTYKILETYPHDIEAYTQGLEFENDTLYESTGQYKESSLRKTDYKTGEVLQKVGLANQYFGEGLTILNNKIYQLTYRENTGFIYNLKTMEQTGTFVYGQSREGWGLCHDAENNHEAGFERLVNDLQHILNLSEENKTISKKGFNPPLANTNANSSSPKKSKKIGKYILIGIVSVILFIAIKTLIAFLAW